MQTKSMHLAISSTVLLILFGLHPATETAGQKSLAEDTVTEADSKAPDEMTKLKELFVGNWTTVEHHEPSAWSPGGEGRGSSVVQLGPGGLSIIEDYKSSTPMGQFAGHGVINWDGGRQEYKLYWFDSMIPVPLIQTCKWQRGEFVCFGEMTNQGKRITARTTYTMITPTSRMLTYESAAANEPLKKMMTIGYKKTTSN